MKPDTLLKLEAALRDLRQTCPLNARALHSLTINIGALAEAMRNRQSRRVRSVAIILAAQAVRIAEEGDPTFEESSPEPQPAPTSNPETLPPQTETGSPTVL